MTKTHWCTFSLSVQFIFNDTDGIVGSQHQHGCGNAMNNSTVLPVASNQTNEAKLIPAQHCYIRHRWAKSNRDSI